MTRASLNYDSTNIATGNDTIVIVDNFQSKRGGVTLDVTDFPNEAINAGHVIIKTTDNATWKPMPLNAAGDTYEAIPADYEYAGILISSIPAVRPFAGVMLRGTVNEKAAPFAYTDEMKAALNLIKFVED